MKRQIIAIGGGGWAKHKNFPMERYLLEQTGIISGARICFLPQASAESRDYITRFYETFLELNASPSWISLFGRVDSGWKQKLLDQDIIFVGGGNTKSMIALWKAWGLDSVLKQAYEQGTLLCGTSAGALCWFEHCITDSVWPLGTIEGLGFLTGSCCPHFDSESERQNYFLKQVKTLKIPSGIALEDFTAAHYINEQLIKIVSTEPNKKAYVIEPDGKKTIEPEILL